MKRQDIRTIDVNAKEWFDKVNGNSYFSGVITVNFGMDNAREYIMPFQYGYGDYFMQEAKSRLVEHNEISIEHNGALWSFCKDNDIILRYNKQTGCKKRELKN